MTDEEIKKPTQPVMKFVLNISTADRRGGWNIFYATKVPPETTMREVGNAIEARITLLEAALPDSYHIACKERTLDFVEMPGDE